MLTGKRAFSGESQASLIASIMSSDPPPVSAAQPMAPPALERAIHKCLAKSPDQRWQTVRDLKSELQWIAEGGSQAGLPAPVIAQRRNREHTAWIGAAAAVLLLIPLAAVAVIHFREQPPVQNLMRFDFSLPPKIGMRSTDIPTPSPDGQHIIFSAIGADQRTRLWIRSLNSSDVQPITGTEDALLPSWSPDGRQIGFVAGVKLKRVDVAGGPPQTICDLGDVMWNYGGASWNRDGVILFGRNATLMRVPAQGGEPKPVREPGKGERE